MFDFIKFNASAAPNDADSGSETYSRPGGLMPGTKVATAHGWCDVAAIEAGCRVLTFDNGLQEVTRVVRHRIGARDLAKGAACWPLRVPAGALGNLAEIQVLPGQLLLLESDAAEAMFNDPFVAVHGGDLDGVNGIASQPVDDALEVVTIHFAQDNVVFVAGGLMALCQGTGCLLGWQEEEKAAAPSYRILETDDVRAVVLPDVVPAGCTGAVADTAANRAA